MREFGPGVFFIILLIMLVIALYLAAIIDVLKSKFRQDDKLIWVLVILLVPVIGPLLYFIIGLKDKIRG